MHRIFLSDSVRSINSLHIIAGIIVVIKHDDTVGGGQVESESSDRGGEQENFNFGIFVETIGNFESLLGVDVSIHF